MGIDKSAKLTLGPVLFNWHPDQWRDFYYKMAEEAPVDTVYLGEVVCFKRGMLFLKVMDDVIERLQSAGKQVVFSALALAMNDKSVQFIENIAHKDGLVEANDMTAVASLVKLQKPFVTGPYINTYNEGTLKSLADKGTTRIVLPFEINRDAIRTLAQEAQKSNLETEVMVYGRTPLAISARCYHARLYDKDQQGCQFVCMEDPEGKEIKTMTEQDFLIVNGKQTLSHTCTNLAQEMKEMQENGITHFRISPHSGDMVHVIKTFKSVLDEHTEPAEAIRVLENTGVSAAFANGYYHGQPGHEWVG